METAVGASGGVGRGGFCPVNDDILENIFSRLPARSFASAACVCKTWNCMCNRILCRRPKLASAMSLNPSLHVAVKEVLEKVLSNPIRPHFAIACIGLDFSLEAVHHLITEAVGSRTPVITNAARGVIGIDALTDELKEVKWELAAVDYNSLFNRNRGIVLALGFLPGFQVDAISLLRPNKVSQGGATVDKFIMDIKEYTASVSDSTSPSCIIMFGNQHVDMKPIVTKLDSAMAEETVIVGDECSHFLSKSSTKTSHKIDGFSLDAVALVIARDKKKPEGLGETIFHCTSSVGTIPFGPELKAVSTTVRGSRFTWVSALMEGDDEILHGQSILKGLKEEIEYDDLETDLFIGVLQNREQSIGEQSLGPSTSLAMYKVLGGDKEYFVVDGVGIRPGDSFLFYHSDSETAASSSYIASQHLATLNSNSVSVFGGLIFSSHSRGHPSFGTPSFNTSPFSANFPGVPLAGMFCAGEIGRTFSRSFREEEDDEDDDDSVRRCLHVYSTVYLVMSHIKDEDEKKAGLIGSL